MSNFIGPSLPHALLQRPSASEGEDTPKDDFETTCSYGPALPPGSQDSRISLSEATAVPKVSQIGPVLPPCHDTPDTRADSESELGYGPCLPPGFVVSVKDTEELRTVVGLKETAVNSVVGPALPPGCGGTQQQEEDDVIGPMPVLGGGLTSCDEKKKLLQDINSRSKAMKDRLTGKDKDEDSSPKREDWMLTLPAEIKPGLGARKFRTGRTDCGDRSVWTDTPADREARDKGLKEKKTKVKDDTTPFQSERDRELSNFVVEYNEKHRSESLMDMHKKRRREELSKVGGTIDRKPFNRDTDLEIPTSLITPAKRKALMKDSKQSLHSKFTHGSHSFL